MKILSTALVLFVTLTLSVAAQTGGSKPNIYLNCPPDVKKGGERIVVHAGISGAFEKVVYFNWLVSDGEIEEGQGTNRLTMRLPADRSDVINVVVEATGEFEGIVEKECIVIFDVPPKAQIVEQFEFKNKEHLEEILDRFLNRLSVDQTIEGRIFIYAESGKKNAEINKLIRDQIDFRGYEPLHLTIVAGHKSLRNLIRFWIIPAGAEPPSGDLDEDESETTPDN